MSLTSGNLGFDTASKEEGKACSSISGIETIGKKQAKSNFKAHGACKFYICDFIDSVTQLPCNNRYKHKPSLVRHALYTLTKMHPIPALNATRYAIRRPT
ncbi:MAG: hypothetical protein KAG53_04155 [Endozoicomonadaceae bacterium]|nr:hypothetical protein [Endozoicomonadaceae bacterium]